MLLGVDEYPFHQFADTFAAVVTSDPMWNDGHYICAADQAGTVALTSNLRLYPNNDVMDGFVCLRYEGHQYNVRVSRVLRPEMDRLQVGPLRIDIVEPLQTVRLVLEPNTISGTGTLTQAGSGTTILTGANTYSGATTISAGTLQVGNAGTSGSLGTGAVTDNSALVFNRTDSVTQSGAISGTGMLTQAGTGTTILIGANTYTGSTAINAGALVLRNDSPSLSTSGFTGTGALTIEPASTSFSSTFTLGSGSPIGSSLSSLTLGKVGNTAAVQLNSCQP